MHWLHAVEEQVGLVAILLKDDKRGHWGSDTEPLGLSVQTPNHHRSYGPPTLH